MRIRHLRDKLILASLVVVVPFVTWSILTQSRLAREDYLATFRFHQTVASHVADGFASYMQDIVSLNHSAGMALWNKHTIPISEASHYLHRVCRSTRLILHTAAIDMHGRVIASDMPGMVGTDMSSHPSIRKIMHGSSWTLSDEFVPAVIGKPAVAISTGIRDNAGTLKGIIASFIDQAHLQSALNPDVTLGRRPYEKVVIVDTKGFVFLTRGNVDPRLNREWAHTHFIRAALKGKTTLIDGYKMPGGQMIMGLSQPIDRLGWAVLAFSSQEEVLGPARRRTIMTALIAAFLAGITVALAIYTGNKLSKPIIDLSNTARSFGSGDLNARASVRTGDELEVLASNFNEMASVLQSRTEQLNASLDKECHERQRASALYLVAQGIVVNMHLRDRLEVIAQALASICGVKRCAIFLRRGDRLIGTAGWGLTKPETFSQATIDIGKEANMVHESLLPGTPVLVQDASTDARVDPYVVQDYNLKGFLALPLVRQQHLVGLAILDNPGEYPVFNEDAINTARGLATLAAIAIENSESFEKWIKVSEAFQGAMLPSMPSEIETFALASRYYSAVEMAELGGDFYDLIRLKDGKIALVIADVSGKGLEAAIFTAMGKYTIRAFSSENPEPSAVLTRTNNAIQGSAGEMGFLTLFYGLLDTRNGKLTYANAGHPPPLVTRETGDTFWLEGEERQPPLGILGGVEYKQWEFQLYPRDVLTCYTDGVVESRQHGEMFDMERLATLLTSLRERKPDEIAEAIHKSVLEFSYGRIQDDIALLIAKYTNV